MLKIEDIAGCFYHGVSGKECDPEAARRFMLDHEDELYNYGETLIRNAEIYQRANGMHKALLKAINDYEREGGPWNVPSEPWIDMARKAIDGWEK